MAKGWPKGVKRGPMSAGQKGAISRGQAQSWSNPEVYANRRKASIACWNGGKRDGDRTVWTPEMDAALIKMFAISKYAVVRVAGPAKIGVGERTLLDRISHLGLRKSSDAAEWSKRNYSFLSQWQEV